MYTPSEGTTAVRDASVPYGNMPTPSERFAGETVLDDLASAPSQDIPLILARYAAVRAWSLLRERHAPAVTAHALTAARAHLDGTDPEWAEGVLLRQLLTAPDPRPLLDRAAEAARASGHAAGARALRQAGHRLQWHAARYPPPSPS